MVDAATLVRGLARNPSAPADVLLRLLDAAPGPACAGLAGCRDLPRAVQEAMACRLAVAVRIALAGHPRVEPGIRRRLLADPDWRVTVRAFGGTGMPPLPDDVLRALLSRIEDAPAEAGYDAGTAARGRIRRLARRAGACAAAGRPGAGDPGARRRGGRGGEA